MIGWQLARRRFGRPAPHYHPIGAAPRGLDRVLWQTVVRAAARAPPMQRDRHALSAARPGKNQWIVRQQAWVQPRARGKRAVAEARDGPTLVYRLKRHRPAPSCQNTRVAIGRADAQLHALGARVDQPRALAFLGCRVAQERPKFQRGRDFQRGFATLHARERPRRLEQQRLQGSQAEAMRSEVSQYRAQVSLEQERKRETIVQLRPPTRQRRAKWIDGQPRQERAEQRRDGHLL